MHEYIEIGQIVNTVGLKGEVRVKPITDDLKRFNELKEVFVEQKGNLEKLIISKVRYYKNMVILTFKGLDNVEQVEKYKGYYLKVDRKDAVNLEEDEYFIVDLIGLDVFKITGENLGKIIDVFPTGSNDVYVVKNNEGKQILIPAISKVVKTVDIKNR